MPHLMHLSPPGDNLGMPVMQHIGIFALYGNLCVMDDNCSLFMFCYRKETSVYFSTNYMHVSVPDVFLRLVTHMDKELVGCSPHYL